MSEQTAAIEEIRAELTEARNRRRRVVATLRGGRVVAGTVNRLDYATVELRDGGGVGSGPSTARLVVLSEIVIVEGGSMSPAPPSGPFVTLHAQRRWQERVQPGAERGDAIAPLKRIVEEGDEVTERPSWGGEWRPGECRYFAHADWPGILAVMARSSGAVVTVVVEPTREEASAARTSSGCRIKLEP